MDTPNTQDTNGAIAPTDQSDAIQQSDNDQVANGAMPSSEAINIDEVVESYGATLSDNNELRDENFKLKQENARLSRSGKEDEDDDELTTQELVDREIARREEEAKAISDHDKGKKESEVRFMERTNPTFRANKAAIQKIARDAQVSLLDAVKLHKERTTEAKEQIEEHDKARKSGKSTETAPSSNSDRVSVPGTAPENKSIADMYREGL